MVTKTVLTHSRTESKDQLGSLRSVDSELARLQAQAAALQTARIAYGRALKQALEEGEAAQEEEVSIAGAWRINAG